MAFEEEAAYALAAWNRFDGVLTSDLTRAVTGAFALVAVSDGDLAQSEVERFLQLLRDRSAAFERLDFTQVEIAFRDLGAALLSDPVQGRRMVLEHIAMVKTNRAHCELVRSAAEIAVVADHRELAREQHVLEEICSNLGLEQRP